MKGIKETLTIAGIVALVAGLLISRHMIDEAQAEIVATCWIGGLLLVGIATAIGLLQRIERRMMQASDGQR